MVAKVILNPYAGRWKALKQIEEVKTALSSENIEFELTITDKPRSGTRLAEIAVQEGFSPIICAGGDGSISEIVNGMMAASLGEYSQSIPPLGLLPLGSANDLVVNLGLPLDLLTSAKIIAAGQKRYLDLGLVNGQYFDNNSAIGLEPCITLIQQRITKISGVLRYLLATIIGIYQNPQWEISIQWENGEYKGPATLVSVGNNALTGGLFYMTPHADPFDGYLTFVHGFMGTRLQILRLLPKTMKPDSGSYIEHPDIHEYHTRWLHIHTEPSTPLHTDGEIQSKAIQDLEYKIIPQALPILVN